jgi:hypothetical protein
MIKEKNKTKKQYGKVWAGHKFIKKPKKQNNHNNNIKKYKNKTKKKQSEK